MFCLVEKTTIEDFQKHMEAFGSTQEDDDQRLRAGTQGEAIAWRMATACDEYDEAEHVKHDHCEQREANTSLWETDEKSVASRDGVRRL